MPDDTSIPVDAPPPAEATELDAVRAKLDATEQQLANFKLAVADYENARKRTVRDAEINKKYAAESFARDLLGALDNLDRALSAAKAAGDTGPLATGVAATAEQFLGVLKRHGVTRIECDKGTVFDPNLHQAVMEQPSTDVAPGEVVQVLQQGFQLHDRVIRPASVIVASNV
ncbi:MAG: nucleotide exchange factor GrpE [Planctomycetaceae bacterium]|nr:nucleotide exchange factor GrpE [Planctomycetaceae bacterium]